MNFDLGPPPGSVTAAAPIADLSYRSYDGPLRVRTFRWWPVALSVIRAAVKKWGFWVVAALAALPYLILGSLLLLMGPVQSRSGDASASPFGSRFSEQFFGAFRGQEIFIFVLALVVGAGAIASDNRANALLVYLSKPITRGDYLLGKWAGLFLPLFAAAFAPALLVYAVCLVSFRSAGFLTQYPWLLPEMLAASAVCALLHTSILLTCSAYARSSRMAGAGYAGLYFLTSILATAIAASAGPMQASDESFSVLISHMSIPGLIQGIAQDLLHVTQHVPRFGGGPEGMQVLNVNGPPMGVLLAIAGGLVAIGLVLTRERIRAVEVVRG